MDSAPPTCLDSDAPAAPPQADANLPWLVVWAVLLAISLAAACVVTVAGRQPLLLSTLCITICLLAAGFDAATGRIPNHLTYTAILLGLLLNCAAVLFTRLDLPRAAELLSAAGPREALLGVLICGGVGLLSMSVAGMGGGDMKLLAAIGALLGLKLALVALLYGLLIAVAYALVNLAIRGRLNVYLSAIALDALNLIFLRQLPAVPNDRPARTVPLAAPLLVGLVLSRVLGGGPLWAVLGGGA